MLVTASMTVTRGDEEFDVELSGEFCKTTCSLLDSPSWELLSLESSIELTPAELSRAEEILSTQLALEN